MSTRPFETNAQQLMLLVDEWLSEKPGRELRLTAVKRRESDLPLIRAVCFGAVDDDWRCDGASETEWSVESIRDALTDWEADD